MLRGMSEIFDEVETAVFFLQSHIEPVIQASDTSHD